MKLDRRHCVEANMRRDVAGLDSSSFVLSDDLASTARSSEMPRTRHLQQDGLSRTAEDVGCCFLLACVWYGPTPACIFITNTNGPQCGCCAGKIHCSISIGHSVSGLHGNTIASVLERQRVQTASRARVVANLQLEPRRRVSRCGRVPCYWQHFPLSLNELN